MILVAWIELDQPPSEALRRELEIRHLHSKLDQLLTRQWQRLLEIQQIQLELMEELARKGGRGAAGMKE